MKLTCSLLLLSTFASACVFAQVATETIVDDRAIGDNGYHSVGLDQKVPADIGKNVSVLLFGNHYLTKNLVQSQTINTLELRKITRKSFPDSIQYITNLKKLTLSSDSVTSIGAWIGNCKKLESLTITGCPNLRKLPDELSNLPNLTSLTIEKTSINQIPAGLMRLASLGSLSLDCSSLKAIPKNLWSMPALKSVSLSGLRTFPQGLANAVQLTHLTLTGTFDKMSDEIAALPRLDFLLVNAPLKSLDCSSASLKTFWLHADSTSLPGEILSNFPNLEKASLAVGGFTSPLKTASLARLKRLSIYVRKETNVAIEGVNPKVNRIHFEGKHLRDVSGISNLPNLERISFEHTQITHLPGDIAQLKNLWQLACVGSKLTEVPEFVYDMPSISELDVRRNLISTPINDKIYSMPQLKRLLISDNKIPNEGALKANGKFTVN